MSTGFAFLCFVGEIKSKTSLTFTSPTVSVKSRDPPVIECPASLGDLPTVSTTCMVNPLKRGLVISRGPWPRSSFRFCYLEDSTVLSERQTDAESDEVELSKVRYVPLSMRSPWALSRTSRRMAAFD